MKYHVKDGWVVDEEGRCSLSERQLREARVEFWGEIERLQAVNAELLAACKVALAEFEGPVRRLTKIASVHPFTLTPAHLQAAIARAEQPNQNPENQT